MPTGRDDSANRGGLFWLGYEINHLKQKDKCDISGKYVEKLIGFISANTDENMLRHSPPATTRNSAAIIEPAVLSNDSGLLRDQWELPSQYVKFCLGEVKLNRR
ncbi:hypothetical protein NUKP23_43620 [Klebsiella variicola]|nr:hypothetical protein NUKP23_43620 [Klebsiella variicola]